MGAHWTECWQVEGHEACRLAEIRRLQVRVSQLESGVREPDWMARLRSPGIVMEDSHNGNISTQNGNVTSGTCFTHPVTLTLHASGPTWRHANDEPPTK